MLGLIFTDKKEAAFAHNQVWRGIGQCLEFGYGNFLCQDTKTYIVLGVGTITLLTYIAAEIVHKMESNRTQEEEYAAVSQQECDKTSVM